MDYSYKTSDNKNFNVYKQQLQAIADIHGALALMQWDQETYMPAGSAQARSRQIATLSELAHTQSTSEELWKLVQQLMNDSTLTNWEQKNISVTHKSLERKRKIPSAFVAEFSKAVSEAFEAWIQARKENNYALFAPHLQKIVDFKKQEAQYAGFSNHIYDAFIDEYDPGITAAQLDAIFEPLLPALQPLLQKAVHKPVDDYFLTKHHYDKDRQWNVGMQLLSAIGFTFNTGRQDISEHPFTTNFASTDVRLTTRIDEMDLTNMTFSCLHEGGHGMYEQGLPYEYYGLPAGEYASLSIHESQSRFWENCIGRSLDFWQGHYGLLQETFPASLHIVPVEKFVAGINKVMPSFIRTEADELTYHYHVYIRYTIEKELLTDQLKVADVKERWNSLYKQYLQVEVPNDNKGCLQDVHWSHGSIGYFPTYSLGSMAAAQIWDTIQKTHPNIKEEIRLKNYSNIHSWLKQHIYVYGKLANTNEILEAATGSILNSSYFLNYAKEKFK
jgi:carboxypeptidase Taq